MTTGEAQETLLDAMDQAARELIKTLNPPTIGGDGEGPETQPIDIKGRIAAFEAVTNYLAIKHKIQPEKDGASGIDRYRDQLASNSGTARRRNRRAAQDHPTEAEPITVNGGGAESA